MSDNDEKKGRVHTARFILFNLMASNIKHGLVTHQVRGYPVNAHIDLKGVEGYQASELQEFVSAPQPEGDDLWSFYAKLKNGRELRVNELHCNFTYIPKNPSDSFQTVILEAGIGSFRIFMPGLAAVSIKFDSAN